MSELHIVQVTTLAAFVTEVPAGSVVRLQSSEAFHPSNTVPWLELNLSLMGHSASGELLTLTYSKTIDVTPGQPRQAWTEAGQARLDAWPTLVAVVQAYLSELYTVREGRYALPSNLTQLYGAFECVRWDTTARAFVRRDAED